MSKIYNHLESYEWLGEFWLGENEAHRLPGILTYTPNDGLCIKLFALRRENNDSLSLKKLNHKHNKPFTLLGYTYDTGPITLLSVLLKSDLSWNPKSEEASYSCQYAILGTHLSQDMPAIKSLTMRFNNLGGFCSPRYQWKDDDYTPGALLEIEFNNATLSLKQSGKAQWLMGNISALLLEDERLKQEIDDAIKPILKRYEKTTLTIKKKIEYFWVIEPTDEKPLQLMMAIEITRELCHLFSFLMRKIINPVEIKFSYKSADDEHPLEYSVLKSQYLNETTIKKMQTNQHNHLLKMTLQDIKSNFRDIINYWSKFINNPLNLIYQTMWEHLYNIHRHYLQHYILLITSIEQWAYSEEENIQKNERYDSFVNKYKNKEIQNKFIKILPENTDGDKIGKALADIRNCIIHSEDLKQPENLTKYKSSINTASINNLSELIFILFIRAIYKKFGIKEEIIRKINEPLVIWDTI